MVSKEKQVERLILGHIKYVSKLKSIVTWTGEQNKLYHNAAGVTLTKKEVDVLRQKHINMTTKKILKLSTT